MLPIQGGLAVSMKTAGHYYDLLFRRPHCVFIAFDLLYLNGKDLRPSGVCLDEAYLQPVFERIPTFKT